jgi:6-phosphogluconate dehydrogenase
MGANMARRLIRGGHDCVVFNRSAGPVQELVKENAIGAASLRDLTGKLGKPRIDWLMVPAAAVGNMIADIVPLLDGGDIFIDGDNSDYIDDLRRARELAEKGIHYVDVGTYLRCGPNGAGHFVKMVHNGIEYGIMAVATPEA